MLCRQGLPRPTFARGKSKVVANHWQIGARAANCSFYYSHVKGRRTISLYLVSVFSCCEQVIGDDAAHIMPRLYCFVHGESIPVCSFPCRCMLNKQKHLSKLFFKHKQPSRTWSPRLRTRKQSRLLTHAPALLRLRSRDLI